MNNSFFCLVVIFAFHLYFLFCVSQDSSGYISIDCGSVKKSSYKGLEYSTDAGFIDSGENHDIQAAIYTDMDDQMMNLRSFPVGKRNCYNLSLTGAAGKKGNTYLITAHFLYGNYDGKNVVPQFDLYLGVEFWATINTDKYLWLEIINVPSSDHVYVCLVNTGNGIPYISALELRPMDAKVYNSDPQASLQFVQRSYFAPGSSNQIIRYPDDIYDRRWSPFTTATNWKELKTTTDIVYDSNTLFLPPSIVLQSAVTPKDNNSDLIVNSVVGGNTNTKFSFRLYFCEVEQHPQQARIFDLYIGPTAHLNITLSGFLSKVTVTIQAQTSENHYTLTLRKSAGSAFPPLLSAMEMYKETHFLQSQTYENDVFAVVNIKATYGLNKSNWQGDPCLPRDFIWEGLDCVTFDNQSAPPRIKYLDLSSSGISGSITPYLSGLKYLEFLDLSHNKLSGPIPDFLAELPSLKVLNISGNKFDGPIPQKLTYKANDGSLLFRIDDRDNNVIKETKKIGWIRKSLIKILALSLVALLMSMAITLFIIYRKRMINRGGKLLRNWKKVDAGIRSRNYSARSTEEESIYGQDFQKFTMGEVKEMTKNFETQIGNGGFGQVFRGTMSDGVEVAIKRLSPKSKQGYDELKAEVKLFKHACHPNLTPIFGYCHEGQEMAIVYKYMPNGSLNHFLSPESKNILTWRQRLNIAFGATQGLLYLHEELRLIHRDIKPDNILLDENFEAKLADYGLAREILEDNTHVTTFAKGSRGYMDPEYHIFQRLCRKSDVFSIGVVLLRLITGKPAVIRIESEDKHITHWLKLRVKCELQEIVDPKLKGNFDQKSAKKALKLATNCTAFTSGPRPTMRKVVAELSKCLNLADAYEESQNLQQSNNQNNNLNDHNVVHAETHVDNLTKYVRHDSKSSC